MKNTVAAENNSILKNKKIYVPLKYLSTFQRSLGMPLNNCKVSLKLGWMKHCVLASAGLANDDADSK